MVSVDVKHHVYYINSLVGCNFLDSQSFTLFPGQTFFWTHERSAVQLFTCSPRRKPLFFFGWLTFFGSQIITFSTRCNFRLTDCYLLGWLTVSVYIYFVCLLADLFWLTNYDLFGGLTFFGLQIMTFSAV